MVYFLVVIAVVLADQLTKLMIAGNFMLFESLPVVPGVFNLTFVVNRGAAFSLLAGADISWRQPFFISVGVAAVAVLTILALRIRREAPFQALSLAFITGGAVGNLIDRIRLGAVIDFLDFYWSGYHWPAFNLADSAICVGVAFYICMSFMNNKGKEHPKEK